ncbi:class I SAM-dependent methyltransferase [Silvimonas amylolytica]|uniref:SAM-dependent methyltransferase n=1 Tax=Silvimonas amylolytica TaxID=449663 RepID=A0ABQ2PG86_9NEIS|nr:class I SAM-dependent methyltransferase [Silvimonas amylolytica]GGP24604.1 SAM-dependent methyltransferase [Silvimonas amylolytica]
MKCRHCHSPLQLDFVDLGFSPPSNAYLDIARLSAPETYFPLRVKVCEQCWLVQTEDFARHDELFDAGYAYFSSTSSTWLAHAQKYVEMIASRLGLGEQSLVIEVAANDGYLLQYVAQQRIRCVGVEPTHSTAEAARSRGLQIEEVFLGVESAEALRARHGAADLVVANNVLAHVPDINDFVAGIAHLLTPQGTVTFEFPHLQNLIEQIQFDTVYHEHFSYLSLLAVQPILSQAGLRVYDVEVLPTHGGSLRVYACSQDATHAEQPGVAATLAGERAAGLDQPQIYRNFQSRAEGVRLGLQAFLLEQKRLGKKVLGYGAAAKGNTLLNYAGVDGLLLAQVADAAPSKQGKYLPGSHIQVITPQALLDARPDFVLILPWNLKHEVMQQLAGIREWGGQFVVAVPEVEIL